MCDTGIALLAYMDGITGSPTLGGVVLAASAAAGSAVYKLQPTAYNLNEMANKRPNDTSPNSLAIQSSQSQSKLRALATLHDTKRPTGFDSKPNLTMGKARSTTAKETKNVNSFIDIALVKSNIITPNYLTTHNYESDHRAIGLLLKPNSQTAVPPIVDRPTKFLYKKTNTKKFLKCLEENSINIPSDRNLNNEEIEEDVTGCDAVILKKFSYYERNLISKLLIARFLARYWRLVLQNIGSRATSREQVKVLFSSHIACPRATDRFIARKTDKPTPRTRPKVKSVIICRARRETQIYQAVSPEDEYFKTGQYEIIYETFLTNMGLFQDQLLQVKRETMQLSAQPGVDGMIAEMDVNRTKLPQIVINDFSAITAVTLQIIGKESASGAGKIQGLHNRIYVGQEKDMPRRRSLWYARCVRHKFRHRPVEVKHESHSNLHELGVFKIGAVEETTTVKVTWLIPRWWLHNPVIVVIQYTYTDQCQVQSLHQGGIKIADHQAAEVTTWCHTTLRRHRETVVQSEQADDIARVFFLSGTRSTSGTGSTTPGKKTNLENSPSGDRTHALRHTLYQQARTIPTEPRRPIFAFSLIIRGFRYTHNFSGTQPPRITRDAHVPILSTEHKLYRVLSST
ncbi:unnamed protein product [Trichogramma brassicae]|uniref:Uncharacterized protein n=1 Tax=Trichogramma brassicae TaxID=86971 RepID=A0A6H5IQ96_9HYME|nr:unnamed protein product [Trichogramma brassicae]